MTDININDKELRGVYDHIEAVRADHSQTASRLSSLETKVDNVASAVNKLADIVAERSKFPIGTVLTGIGLVVTLVVVLAGGYVGKPLSRHEVTLSDLDNRITNYQKDMEYHRGVTDTKVSILIQSMDEFESRDYTELNRLAQKQSTGDLEQLKELKDRLRSIEANRFTKEDARSLIKDLIK